LPGYTKNLLRNADSRRFFREEPTNDSPELIGDNKQMAQEPEMKVLSFDELAWLEKLERTVKESIGKFDLSIESFSEQMLLSSRQLQRRVQLLTGLSPNV